MKSVFIFGTKFRMFLCEIPLIITFTASIYFNGGMTNLVKLYPLIIASGAAIIFMFIYLLRGVSISAELVRSVGLFSSKDRAIVNKDKTLVLILRPRHKIKIELYGKDDAPDLDWIDKSDEGARSYVNLYRDIAVGGVGAVRRVLSAFLVPASDISEIIKCESFDKEYRDIAVSKKKGAHGMEYSVKFLRTI